MTFYEKKVSNGFSLCPQNINDFYLFPQNISQRYTLTLLYFLVCVIVSTSLGCMSSGGILCILWKSPVFYFIYTYFRFGNNIIM